jgi:hypothetical protein
METATIYNRKSDGILYSPFNLSIDDMKKLILINFEKDPDELYNTFELQESADRNGASRLLVIAYGNGFTDIYHQPLFPFASQKSVLNNPTFFERTMEGAKFEIKNNILEICFNFQDKNGREIIVRLTETRLNRKNLFSCLPLLVRIPKIRTLSRYTLYTICHSQSKSIPILVLR